MMTLTLSLVLAALAAAPAAAQVPAGTAWAGGEIADAPPATNGFNGREGDANVGLRTSADGRAIKVSAAVLLPKPGRLTCQVAGAGDGTVRSDGTFRIRTRRTLA